MTEHKAVVGPYVRRPAPRRATDDAQFDLTLEAVCRGHGLPASAILSRDRHECLMDARHSLAYILREYYQWELRRIASYLGRDHSTIINSVRRVAALMETDALFRRRLARCIAYVVDNGWRRS